MNRRTWWLLGILLVILIVSDILWFHGNFRVVIPNQIYRSAQLHTGLLERRIKQHGIRSILNLRGARLGRNWYERERAVAQRLGVSHYDLSLNAQRLPSITELEQLIQRLNTAERPLLIHCHAGADRAGLASAIALLMLGEATLDEIQTQVSLRYYVVRSDSTGRQLLKSYRIWLKKQESNHTPQHFLDWVQYGYLDPNGNLRFYIDEIGLQRWKGNDQYPSGYHFKVDRSEDTTFLVKGWALDYRNRRIVKQVEVMLGDYSMPPARHKLPNSGVVKQFGAEFHHAGWLVEQPAMALPVGCHKLRLRITRLDGSLWDSPPKALVCFQ